MGLLDRLEQRASPELPSVSLTEGGTWLTELMGAEPTYTGRSLTKEKATRLVTVGACIQAISQDVGKIPLDEFRRLPNGGRERATDSPRYHLAKGRPNREQTQATFRAWVQSAALGWGNGFAEIARQNPDDPESAPVALWPLLPQYTKAKTIADSDGRRVKYVETWARRAADPDAPREPIALLPGEYIHLPGSMSFDGVNARSPLVAFKQAIALGLGMEEWKGRFYDNNATPQGWISVPGYLPQEKRDEMRDHLRKSYGGMSSGHRTGILWEAATYQASGVSPEAQQLVSSENLTDHRICSIFRVPPHKVGVSQPGVEPKSGMEQQAREYVTDTLMYWFALWEQVLHWELTPAAEREQYFWKFNTRDLVRGDAKAEAETLGKYVSMGALTRNQVRQKIDENPAPPEQGLDDYLVPLNMVPSKLLADAQGGDAGALETVRAMARHDLDTHYHGRGEADKRARGGFHLPPEERAIRSATLRNRLRLRQVGTFRRAAERYVAVETKALTRALKANDLAEFERLAAEFWRDFPPTIRREIGPVLETFGGLVADAIADELGAAALGGPRFDAMVADVITGAVDRHIRLSQNQIRGLATDAADFGAARDAISGRLDEWRERRPGKIASGLSVRAGGAFAIEVYAEGGVQRKIWTVFGESCELCEQFRDRVVGIRMPFARQGDIVAPEGVEPLTISRDTKHPPLHGGCDCSVRAG